MPARGAILGPPTKSARCFVWATAQSSGGIRSVNERTPGRLNTLLGLARASLYLNDEAAAGRYYDQILETATPNSERPGVIEARTFQTGHK
ncbi:MAG: hypothetical protein KJO98_00290 [Rhodothermia bacterium]|nr:hypothetical protein [Rhodothermia bacterium]